MDEVMATVNDEDVAFSDRWRAGIAPLSAHVADYRERIESRKDVDWHNHLVARDKRIAALEAQLDATESARDKAIDKCAAAKPVLAMCDSHRKHVEECRAAVGRFAKDGERMPSLVALFADLIHVVDTLCPPPKAPPTDAELASFVEHVAGKVLGRDRETLVEVADALRARGAK